MQIVQHKKYNLFLEYSAYNHSLFQLNMNKYNIKRGKAPIEDIDKNFKREPFGIVITADSFFFSYMLSIQRKNVGLTILEVQKKEGLMGSSPHYSDVGNFYLLNHTCCSKTTIFCQIFGNHVHIYIKQIKDVNISFANNTFIFN